MREWLVIESAYKNAVFRSDDAKNPVGYIPREAAEKLLGRDLGGTVWFTREDSERMRGHPEWSDTEPPLTVGQSVEPEGKAMSERNYSFTREAHELKPCPFCGNSRPTMRSNGIGDFYVLCEDPDDDAAMQCGASSSDHSCETQRGAADRWNRRKSDT